MDRLKLRMLSAILLAAPILHGAASISLTPNNESTVTGGTRQYTATVMGLANTAVDWYVNNLPGGNSTFSTISPTTTPYGQFTLTCTGTGFTANALIWINGTQYPTIVINSNKVSAVV